LKAITQRLENIEKQNRTLKRFGLAILSLVAAIVAMGQAQASRSIVASEFRLMDSSGTVRATLGFVRNEPTQLKSVITPLCVDVRKTKD
jgi:hypothetical protein